jgi:hypothetical protein
MMGMANKSKPFSRDERSLMILALVSAVSVTVIIAAFVLLCLVPYYGGGFNSQHDFDFEFTSKDSAYFLLLDSARFSFWSMTLLVPLLIIPLSIAIMKLRKMLEKFDLASLVVIDMIAFMAVLLTWTVFYEVFRVIA